MQLLSKNKEVILSRLISSDKSISSSEILERCNLSRKTITKEIQELDSVLLENGATITSHKGKGYSIKILDQQQFAQFCSGFSRQIQRSQYLYLEKNVLAYLILFELITSNRYIKIDDLAAKFHYSKSIVSKNIKTLKTLLSKFGCILNSRPKYGLKIEGSEWNLRLCLIFAEKIARNLGDIPFDKRQEFEVLFDRHRYKFNQIETEVKEVLKSNSIYIPEVLIVKIHLYLILTQTRAHLYNDLTFSEETIQRITTSRFFPVSVNITNGLMKKGIRIKDKDIYGLAILMTCYASRLGKDEIEPDIYDACKKDTLGFIEHLSSHFIHVENNLDETFVEEFICFLAGLKERVIYQVPNDDESVFVIKKDGSFIVELCCDFGLYYYEKYGVKLPESELLFAYYTFSSSFIRNVKNHTRYKVLITSRHGISVARNLGTRILVDFRQDISIVEAIEFNALDSIDQSQYDFLITDIDQRKLSSLMIPLIRLDFFRDSRTSQSITDCLSYLTKLSLQELIIDQNILKDREIKSKHDVFEVLAKSYVSETHQEAFILDCIQKDAFISNERGNRIAFISTSSVFYPSNKVVFLFSKTPFIWDNELVQMIIFFNRRDQRYTQLKVLNSLLLCSLHASANIVHDLSLLDAQGIIDMTLDLMYAKNLHRPM